MNTDITEFLFSLIFSFIFPPCFPVIILAVLLFVFLSHQGEQDKVQKVWRPLATATGLTFVPGSFLGKLGQLIGNYRGYQLRLEAARRGQGKGSYLYTRLELSREPPADGYLPLQQDVLGGPIAFDDMVNFLIPNGLPYQLKEALNAEPGGRKIIYEHKDLETNPQYLQFLFDLLSDLIDRYPTVLALGGEAVPALRAMVDYKRHVLGRVAIQLLRDIAWQTTTHLKPQSSYLICPRCWARCTPHKVELPWWESVTYYGCRVCGQSRRFIQPVDRVIAMLDSEMKAQYVTRAKAVWVNWLTYGNLFDFDEVRIMQATDEEVERFAVQVGNDTDPLRRPRYDQMRCLISARCNLSENTHRILQRMFGQVKVKKRSIPPATEQG